MREMLIWLMTTDLVSTGSRYLAPKLMDVKQAAEAARACPSTLREWLAKGRLPYRKPGKRVLIRRFDLAAFLDVPESDLEIGGAA